MNYMNELTTIEEAKALAAKLGSIGGGVAEIYVPEYLGPFATPQNGDSKFHHFKFHNGAGGFNAGLIRNLMLCFPSRWLLMIATEVNTTASFPVNQF
jgi:hypothetical protein